MGISSGLGVAGAVPIGVVNPFAGATAPSGWLLCFGQAVSRTQYSGLFAVLNTTYGSGDGSTTFTLPDMRGRAVAGKDDMGGTAAARLTSTVLSASNTLGATGGTQTHTLTGAQLPTDAAVFNFNVNSHRTDGNTGWAHQQGGGAAHTNTQPTIVLNYIIKAQ